MTDDEVTDCLEMPRFEVGPERARLGFESAVVDHFGFLAERGYHVAEVGSTFVRFERAPAFVNVFHGRGSYELGVEIGRVERARGEVRERRYHMRYLATAIGGAAAEAYRARAAVTEKQVRRFVAEMGEWLERYGSDAVDGDEATFRAVADTAAAEGERLLDSMRVTTLRRQADDAWRVGDLATVVEAYGEIDRELKTVELRAFERGRMAYALKRLSGDG